MPGVELVQQFLVFIRLPIAAETAVDPDEWVTLTGQFCEHGKCLDGARVERLLGSDLGGSKGVLLPNKTVNDLADAVLSQQGRFVAIVEPDKTFRSLVDRSALLEGLAREVLKEPGPGKF
jgi:hypothetical protein